MIMFHWGREVEKKTEFMPVYNVGKVIYQTLKNGNDLFTLVYLTSADVY